jgi:DNA-3-methyladenine glycosylase II
MARVSRGFDTEDAFAYLTKRDRKLGKWMERIGPIEPDPRWRKPFDPVDALARAILYQQLSGKAAATIVGRVETAIASDRFHCDTLARIDDPGLRACGVSGNKALAVRDLALREERGEIPTLRQMLMFRLGRPDVLPVDDLGIRKGAQLVDKLDEMPAPKVLAARGEKWGPYRTYASLYLWRIVDSASEAKRDPTTKPVKRSQG